METQRSGDCDRCNHAEQWKEPACRVVET